MNILYGNNIENKRENNIIVNNLNKIYNDYLKKFMKINFIINKQNNIITKYNKFLNNNHNYINDQNYNLYHIKNNIQLKQRLIDINNYEYNRKNTLIYVITSFFILLGYLFIILVLYLSNKLTLSTFLINCVGIIVIYIIYLTWYYDFFGLRDVTKELSKLDKKLLNEAKEIQNDIDDYLFKTCDCPNSNHNNHKGEKLPKYQPKYTSYNQTDFNNIWY